MEREMVDSYKMTNHAGAVLLNTVSVHPDEVKLVVKIKGHKDHSKVMLRDGRSFYISDDEVYKISKING